MLSKTWFISVFASFFKKKSNFLNVLNMITLKSLTANFKVCILSGSVYIHHLASQITSHFFSSFHVKIVLLLQIFIMCLSLQRMEILDYVTFSSVQSLSCVQLFVTPWTTACQASCPSPTPGACSNSCPSS